MIETREADWPDYNYGNWQDVANNPKLYSQVLQCLVEAGVTNIYDIVSVCMVTKY
ncbi:hypothetical protein [Floccifex sp.]|uniref:hypothetical protein n=1 Tax=Floccifex sp. TaxID=2815810 RepID=UPI002A749551|nr:hypothetical protein [Floccifex sp.]MDD7280501.1 hypothetical protein [Erysipelotrichaceae bacterium]MDY2958545.1 hypothetical protein [Floccifex sp.]